MNAPVLATTSLLLAAAPVEAIGALAGIAVLALVAIALVMQYMASGFAWAVARQRVPYHTTIALGVMAACLTGVGAWFAGRPFLTSDFGYVTIPPLEKFELATAMAFDIGVFLCVIGAVMLALDSLSSMARRAGETVNLLPMDIDPARRLAKQSTNDAAVPAGKEA